MKTMHGIVFFYLLLAIVDGYKLNAGTVAYYRFEEGANGLAASGTNTILDSSGNGLNGTAFGSVTYTSNVPVNPIPLTDAANLLSLSFDGSSGRIFIPDDPQFALTNSLTLEAFIYATSPGAGPFTAGQIIFRGDDRSGLDPYTLTVLVRNGTTNVQFQITDQNNDMAAIQWPITLYNWHHVAGTLNGSNGVMSLYIDGALVTQTTTSIRPFGVLTGPNPGLGIGNVESANYDEYFQGLIDEARISDEALVPSQFLIGTPVLTAVQSGTNIVLTWSANYIGYILQSTTNLLPATWSGVATAPVVANGQNIVSDPVCGARKFYRLSQ